MVNDVLADAIIRSSDAYPATYQGIMLGGQIKLRSVTICIDFHGDPIFLVLNNGEPFVPALPIVNALGIDWNRQRHKLNNIYYEFKSEMLMVNTEAAGQRKMLCLPLRKLCAWLTSIKCDDAAFMKKLKLFRSECDTILWAEWIKLAGLRTNMPTAKKPNTFHAHTDPVSPLGKTLFRRPASSALARDAEVLEFVVEQLRAYISLDEIVRRCHTRFGAERTPGRSTIARLVPSVR